MSPAADARPDHSVESERRQRSYLVLYPLWDVARINLFPLSSVNAPLRQPKGELRRNEISAGTRNGAQGRGIIALIRLKIF